MCKSLTTGLTAQLMSVMLRDSAHIQEGDANWHNQKGKRAGLPPRQWQLPVTAWAAPKNVSFIG